MDSQTTSASNGNTQTGGRVWGFWATALLGIAVMAVSLLTQTLVVLALAVISVARDPSNDIRELLDRVTGAEGLIVAVSTIAGAVVSLGFIALLVRGRKGISIAEYLGLNRISKKTILVLLGATLAFIVLLDGVSVSLDRPAPEFMTNVYGTSVWPALLWVAVVVFAPLFEETLFRGFLFQGFRSSRIGLAGAIVVPSFFWSLLHVQYGGYEIASIFFLGIILGIARYKTNSLWSPILMHAVLNFVATLSVALKVESLFG